MPRTRKAGNKMIRKGGELGALDKAKAEKKALEDKLGYPANAKYREQYGEKADRERAISAAAASVKKCFIKKGIMGGPIAGSDSKLAKDFRFCSGKPVTYTPGSEVQPTCRTSNFPYGGYGAIQKVNVPSYAKRWTDGDYRTPNNGACTPLALKMATGLAGGKRRTKKRHYKHPKKGRKSRTHKGRKDFTTKKTSKVFNRRKHYQRKSAKGVKRRPFRK